MGIFDFDDYRVFLLNYVKNLPRNGWGELNRIAQFISVHPSLVSQVLAGNKNLNLEQAQMLCEYLNFSNLETEYFMTMVQHRRAGTTKLRKYFKDKTTKLKESSSEIGQWVQQDRQLSDEEKAVFYSHWHYASIWLFLSIGNGKSLDEVSSRFQISRERGVEVLHFLLESHLCVFNDGLYKMGPQSIHLDRGSIHLPRHHTNWRLRAIEMSDRIMSEELMYTAPISISRADFALIRTRLTEVIKEATEKAVHSKAEDVACFAMDLFWVKK